MDSSVCTLEIGSLQSFVRICILYFKFPYRRLGKVNVLGAGFLGKQRTEITELSACIKSYEYRLQSTKTKLPEVR
jgi:hypothetical protein